jgi:hypothetical protein
MAHTESNFLGLYPIVLLWSVGVNRLLCFRYRHNNREESSLLFNSLKGTQLT